MGAVIGDLLPLAVGVAISPIPIIAVILMLLAPRAGAASMGFALGWTIGIVVVTGAVSVLADSADVGGGGSGGSDTGAWIKLGLGVLLLLVALPQWRSRPAAGETAALPKWMSAIDRMTPVKATGLGTLLSAVNPKNLLLCIAAGVTVGSAGLSAGDATVTVAVFVVLAASTVLVPTIGYAVAQQAMRPRLEELRTWLEAHNAAVMAVLLLVIGASLIGKGLGGVSS